MHHGSSAQGFSLSALPLFRAGDRLCQPRKTTANLTLICIDCVRDSNLTSPRNIRKVESLTHSGGSSARRGREPPPSPSFRSTVIDAYHPTEALTDAGRAISISPDGRAATFVAAAASVRAIAQYKERPRRGKRRSQSGRSGQGPRLRPQYSPGVTLQQ